jgi:hypothetical protein
MAYTNAPLSQLTEACQHKAARSDDEVIELGATTWFRGMPAHAEPGTVALSMGDAQIIIREKDVRAVAKDDDRFKVEVSSEANILLRIEKAVRAGGDSECTCCGGHGQTQPNRDAPAKDAPTGGGGNPKPKGSECYDVKVGSSTVRICIAQDFDAER